MFPHTFAAIVSTMVVPCLFRVYLIKTAGDFLRLFLRSCNPVQIVIRRCVDVYFMSVAVDIHFDIIDCLCLLFSVDYSLCLYVY